MSKHSQARLNPRLTGNSGTLGKIPAYFINVNRPIRLLSRHFIEKMLKVLMKGKKS